MRGTTELFLVYGSLVAAATGEQIGGQITWAEAVAKADRFVAQLNITEKISMVTGAVGLDSGFCTGNIKAIPRVGFGGLCLLDGPTAINAADLISIFPAGITTAATWDKALMYQRGIALAEEFRGKGGHVILGPVSGPLGRHPLGGRNWEGFSPDPYLTGHAMQATIRGMQSVGVQTCSKHYIGFEQDPQRGDTAGQNSMTDNAISSNIDDRTMHELYLWPFADSVKAGTTSIMCSYNGINGTYACENDNAMNQLLKKEVGFEATPPGPKSINSGLDMNMPGPLIINNYPSQYSYWGPNITTFIDKGLVSTDRLNDMVRRIMTPYYYFGQDAKDYPTPDPALAYSKAIGYGTVSSKIPIVPARDVQGNHSFIIRKIGTEATVLLKNTNQTLPLVNPKVIGVFGNDAADPTDGLLFDRKAPFEVGTLDIGAGSGSGRHTYLVSPLEAIKTKARQMGARVQYITRNSVLAANNFKSIFPTPDVCLVFLNTFAAEGQDRLNWEADWNSTLVVQNVARRCNNTVVVTHSAGINTLPWALNPNVTAILAAHLPGQESGNAIVEVLWGTINPSGRLPYTIPRNESDYNFPVVSPKESERDNPAAYQSNFTEGLLIDYRHFDNRNIKPLYEFGYGLSYTTFDLDSRASVGCAKSNLTDTPSTTLATVPGGNPELWEVVVCTSTSVKNTGKVAGATVVQLYLSLPQDQVPSGTPVQALRGFEKVFLQPGQSEKVKFELLRRDVSYWDVLRQTWVIPKGPISLRFGFSSRDIKESVDITLRS